jgi:endonuclease/exonuclease/phosphatase family metal-dependent hydrolase
MRIICYNIFKGGGSRLPRIEKILKAARPDVIGILEANGWDAHQERLRKQVQKMLGARCAQLTTTKTGYHLTAFSNAQPKKFIRHKTGFHHAVTGATFDIPRLGQLAVLFYHANPFSEETRVAEYRRLLRILKKFPHAVVMGDFNAISPRDPYGKAFLARVKKCGIKKFGTNKLRFDAIRTLERGGMIDAAHALKKPFTATAPTPWNRDRMHSVPVRLDYAFVTHSLKPFLKNFRVLKNADSNRASDHFPILLELKSP